VPAMDFLRFIRQEKEMSAAAPQLSIIPCKSWQFKQLAA